MRRTVARIAVVLGCAIASAFLGCGEPAIGDAVKGKVTFKGAPIPAGMIYFDPDTSAGGQGAQGSARIKEGAFDTAQSGRGVPTGGVLVRIEGFEKHPSNPESFGPMICKWETKDAFQGGGEKTYDVPESAAVQAPTGPVVDP